MNNISFKPWIGESYGQTSLGKLFIVGESHYGDDNEIDMSNMTIEAIKDYAMNSKIDFYNSVAQILNPTDPPALWTSVAFANGVQRLQPKSRHQLSRVDLDTVAPAIKSYLDIVKPDKMIVFSINVWEKGLNDKHDWYKYVTHLTDEKNKKTATVCKFNYDGGHCFGIGVHHPSSLNPPFKTSEWIPLINKFLETDFNNYNKE